jgi:hypothetical protein
MDLNYERMANRLYPYDSRVVTLLEKYFIGYKWNHNVEFNFTFKNDIWEKHYSFSKRSEPFRHGFFFLFSFICQT